MIASLTLLFDKIFALPLMLMVFVDEDPLIALKTTAAVLVSSVITVTFTAPETPDVFNALAKALHEVKFVVDEAAPELIV